MEGFYLIIFFFIIIMFPKLILSILVACAAFLFGAAI
jgi:hypothetical protein